MHSGTDRAAFRLVQGCLERALAAPECQLAFATRSGRNAVLYSVFVACKQAGAPVSILRCCVRPAPSRHVGSMPTTEKVVFVQAGDQVVGLVAQDQEGSSVRLFANLREAQGWVLAELGPSPRARHVEVETLTRAPVTSWSTLEALQPHLALDWARAKAAEMEAALGAPRARRESPRL